MEDIPPRQRQNNAKMNIWEQKSISNRYMPLQFDLGRLMVTAFVVINGLYWILKATQHYPVNEGMLTYTKNRSLNILVIDILES